ncbi:hypothetical protein Q3407_24110 [Pseudomonas fulva]|nr:hypothetical protein Q3407_24110 [Pseudomonas fulva]
MNRPTAFKSALGLVAGIGLALQAHAGIPVIDGANVALNKVTSIESIAQTAKQIEEYATQVNQYKTQLDQYENMIKNTVAPAAYIWDEANNTINKLMRAQDMLDYYTNQAGSFDSYLDKFQDTSYYRNSPAMGAADAQLKTRRPFRNNRTWPLHPRKTQTMGCSRASNSSKKT